MIKLPTIEISQDQADRILDAFGSVEQYRKWLREQVVRYVVEHEDRLFESDFSQERAVRASQARQELTAAVMSPVSTVEEVIEP